MREEVLEDELAMLAVVDLLELLPGGILCGGARQYRDANLARRDARL